MSPRASLFSAQPADVGLYRAENEHDACGVAMVATMRGQAGHDIVEHALTALRNLDHRGATGADPLVGDGAGILTQIPDAFLREVSGLLLPAAGAYAAGLAFLPTDEQERAGAVEAVERIAAEEGLTVLGSSPASSIRPFSTRRSSASCWRCSSSAWTAGSTCAVARSSPSM